MPSYPPIFYIKSCLDDLDLEYIYSSSIVLHIAVNKHFQSTQFAA